MGECGKTENHHNSSRVSELKMFSVLFLEIVRDAKFSVGVGDLFTPVAISYYHSIGSWKEKN